MRHRFKRTVALMLVCVLLPLSFAYAQDEKLQIIATIFPAYDFARTIAGNHAVVRLLLPPGSESHSYEPSPQDIIAIQNADLFIYVGSPSDHWIEEILFSMGNSAPHSFRMMDCVHLLEEELSHSMEHVHTHDEHCEQDHTHSETELDEHVWTSPPNAMRIVSELCETLKFLSPDHAISFDEACSSYLSELKALDQAFADTVASGKRDLIIFGDRFPFRYFADAYQLRYDAAFPGCSEDSEPSVRTVISLIDTVREQKIPVIFYLEFSSRRTADILAEETGANPLLFHSCHNVSAEELANGASYLSLMQQNLIALKEALN